MEPSNNKINFSSNWTETNDSVGYHEIKRDVSINGKTYILTVKYYQDQDKSTGAFKEGIDKLFKEAQDTIVNLAKKHEKAPIAIDMKTGDITSGGKKISIDKINAAKVKALVNQIFNLDEKAEEKIASLQLQKTASKREETGTGKETNVDTKHIQHVDLAESEPQVPKGRRTRSKIVNEE